MDDPSEVRLVGPFENAINLSPESAKCDPRGSTSLNYVHRTCLIGIIEKEKIHLDLHFTSLLGMRW